MKKNSGQITLEAVLILSVLVSIALASTRYVRNQQFLSSLVQGPWSMIAGMIENGYWSTPQRGKAKHPNQIERHGTPEGDQI